MKVFLKILLFLLSIFQANISEAKSLVFDVAVSEIKLTVENIQNKNESTLISENDFDITCKSQSKSVDYRSVVFCFKATAAKGVPSRFGQIRGGIQKAQDLIKSNYNLKLLDGKRIDLKGRHPLSKGHYNKVTKEQLGYPHVYDPAHPGGVRAPNANDYIDIFNLFK